MLFHITGSAGSGKTTLGKKLSSLPNTIVLDTDDIYDTNAIELLNDPTYDKIFENNVKVQGFWKIVEKKNYDDLYELLKNNKNKNIIMVGMTIYPPPETDVIGYTIDIDSNDLFYQLNKRTIETICTNCIDITKLFEEEKNKYKVDLKLLFEYKIRLSFPILPNQIDESVANRKKHSEELGYKYLKADEIIEEITTIINDNN